jgi:hypothetical protein
VVRAHGADDAEVIDALGDVGEEATDFGAALAMGLELPERFGQVHGVVALAALPFVDADRFTGIAEEERFGIEGIDVGDAAVAEDEDDAFGFGLEEGGVSGEGVAGLGEEA